jgi:hypothetical protein
MVDKWLFDKGLTYQEVADACFGTFGLRVSRSSVGRYFEREAGSKVRKQKAEGKIEKGKFGTPGENYQECLKWMADWAVAELNWPVSDEQDIRMVLRCMRLLIAARSERSDSKSVALERRKFQIWAAKDCLKHFRTVFDQDQPLTPGQEFEDTPAPTPALSPRRGGNECRSGYKHRREREEDERRRAARHERETWYLGI